MGKLFAFSGIDGSGKTTVIERLHLELTKLKISTAVFNNHEPFSTYWNFIKRVKKVCEARNTDFPHELDRFLQVLELGTKIEDILPPLLKKFDAVLSDRYIWDRLVYGKLGGDMGIAETALEAIIYRPDLTFFLKVGPETAEARIKKERDSPMDWKETPEMLRAAKKMYETEMRRCKNQLITIDAEKNISEVAHAVKRVILENLGFKKE